MSWVARLIGRRRLEAQLDRELRDHVERQIADYVTDGMTEADARRRVRLEFGGIDQVKELCRDARGTRWIEDLAADVRYGWRGLRKSPGFTAVAALTLALGIGANLAIFGLIDALLLRQLPVRDPDELVTLLRVQGGQSGPHFSYPQVQELAGHREVFSSLTGFGDDPVNVGPPDALELTGAVWVSGGYFATLGLAPVRGRLLTPSDDLPGAAPAAVISDGYWARRFRRAPDAIDRSLLIEGIAVPIVGITPPGFVGATVGTPADITLAIQARPQLQPERKSFLGPGARWLRILARPRAGLSPGEVETQAAVIWAQWLEATTSKTLPADARTRALSGTLRVQPGATGTSHFREPFRRPLFIAMGFVTLVLLIACVNVATLLVARGTARRREIALRLAVGAGRGRIVRQLLAESAVIAALGAIGGVGVAMVGSSAIVRLIDAAQNGPGASTAVVLAVEPNLLMLAFTLGVTVVTMLVFGSAPAWRTSRMAPFEVMNAGSSRIAGTRGRLTPALIVAQMALSLVLVIAAGLFVRTLQNLRSVERGFQHEGVVLVDIDPSRAGYSGPRLRVLAEELLTFVEGLPGVVAASAASITPLMGGGISMGIAVNGVPLDGELHFNNVGPRYFKVLHTGLLAGREFTPQDNETAPPVAIVNEAFVRQFIREGSPIGQRVAVIGSKLRDMHVVGVVEDAAYDTLREAPPPTVYAPLAQRGGGLTLVIDARGGSYGDLSRAIRDEVQPKLAGKPIRVRTLTAQLESSLALERLMATLAASFGTLALTLAAIGLYGVVSWWVASRTREIGVRLALGAARSSVARMVLGDAVRLVTIGVAMALPIAWALSRFVSKMLFGVTPADWATITTAVAVLMVAGVAAAAVPARRAMAIEPHTTLRLE